MAVRRQGGFTLVEMVVVLAVTGVALMLAAGMLREAHVLATAAGRQLDDPLAEVATRRLRSDVQGSDRVLSGFTGPQWLSGPLDLVGYYPGTLLRYQVADGELQRLVVDTGGEVLGREVWIHRLVGWRWRQVTPKLVDVEITYLRAPEASDWRLAGGPGVPPPDRVERELLRLALRGEGRGAAW